MQEFEYRTKGTCARGITFELDDEKNIHNVQFYGGCNGNLNGISSLIEGMPAEEVADKVAGTTCGMKGTSCPDQLSLAIRQAMGL